MNKNWLASLGILLVLPISVFADGPVSGIDWNASRMDIDFARPDGIQDPNFTCFGANESGVGPFSVQSFLSDLGFSDENPAPRIDTCFQQAGDYTIEITLFDLAGNQADPETFTLRVMPSDVSIGTSTIQSNACDGLVANNQSACSLSIRLLDDFSNPVYRLSTAEIAPLTGEFNDDANLGDENFRSGLRIGGEPLEDAVNLDTEIGEANFMLTAIAPSIARVGNYLAKVVPRILTFSVVVSEIGGDGEPTGTPVAISLDSPVLRFSNPMALEPSSDDFLWGGESASGDIALSASGLENFSFIGTLEKRDNFVYENEALPVNKNFAGAGSTTIATTIRPEGWEEGAIIDDNSSSLALSTLVEYTIDDGGTPKTIRYPAGGLGLTEAINGRDPEAEENVIGYNSDLVNFRIVGADIEGGVAGRNEEMVIQAVTGDDNTFLVGNVSGTDIRQQISENTIRLIRGSDNITTGNTSFSSLLDDYDNADVYIVEDGNVTISGQLPTGKNTLIIKNGNLVVEDNVTYEDPTNDSFGFILMNDEASSFPETGNIFVRETVRQMVGTYYADGGIMSVGEVIPANDLNLEHVTNSPSNNTKQLLLTGTLFTKNTLGGSLIQNVNGKYYTPWGETEGGAQADKDLAMRYDLHYVRRYAPDLHQNDEEEDDNIAYCAPAQGQCDDNENAFVIRIDRKASTLTPPGFGSSGSVSR